VGFTLLSLPGASALALVNKNTIGFSLLGKLKKRKKARI
jgi:hypothetical protein